VGPALPDQIGKDKIDDASQQGPAPAADDFAIMQRHHDRQNALNDEEGDHHHGQRQYAFKRLGEKQDTDNDGQKRREDRPAGTGKPRRLKEGDGAENSADDKQPADENIDRERRDLRQQDGPDAENGKQDALKQDQLPMIGQFGGDLLSQIVQTGRSNFTHGALPE